MEYPYFSLVFLRGEREREIESFVGFDLSIWSSFPIFFAFCLGILSRSVVVLSLFSTRQMSNKTRIMCFIRCRS